MFKVLLTTLWSSYAAAAVLSAPTATITPQPELRKRAITTAGYYSTGSEDGTILWGTVTYEAQGSMVATSGSQFLLCASNSCNFGSCSGNNYVMSTTTIYCGSSSSLTCSSNLMYTDVTDTAPLTNFWCDSATETGFVLYKKTPTGGASSPVTSASSESSQSTSSPSTTTGSTSSTSTSSVPVITSPPLDPPKKSTPIGAIVGGAVGGIAVIGIIIVAVVFLLRRKRAIPPGQQTYAPPQQHQAHDYHGAAIAPPPEKTPAATTNAYPYAVEVGSAPAPPMSPVPQYTPNNGAVNELPATRM